MQNGGAAYTWYNLNPFKPVSLFHQEARPLNYVCSCPWSRTQLHAIITEEIKQNVRVHSFEIIQIRISDLWHSFQANPFSDQWSTKSILDKDSSNHWSAWSKDWSNTFLWSKDPNLIILPSNAQFQTGTSYISRKDCWQSLYKFCDKGEIKTIL